MNSPEYKEIEIMERIKTCKIESLGASGFESGFIAFPNKENGSIRTSDGSIKYIDHFVPQEGITFYVTNESIRSGSSLDEQECRKTQSYSTSPNFQVSISPQLLKTLNKIDSIKRFDPELMSEAPNTHSLNRAKKIINSLNSDRLPYRIAPLTDGGICLFFQNQNNRLYLEIYNDGDLGYISESIDLRTTLENKDLKSITSAQFEIERFFVLA